MDLVKAHGPDNPIIKISEPKLVVNKMKDLDMLYCKDSIILKPQSILELYSPKTMQTGEIHLNDIYCFDGDQTFIVIDCLSTNTFQDLIWKKNKEKFSNNIAVRSDTTTEHVT